MELLRVENVSHRFKTKKEYTIKDISFSVEKGETVSILGTSGVGKTTLFQIISGLMPPQEGRIFLNADDITGESGHFGYMLQKDLLLAHKTIEENVVLPVLLRMKPGKSRGLKSAVLKRIEEEYSVNALLEDFGLAECKKLYPAQLSGGMRQRAALLRTYMFGGELMPLDEPFSALDAITKSRMHSWYLDISNRLKLAALFITHDIDEALLLSDRIIILSGPVGHIEEFVPIPASKTQGEPPTKKGETFLLSPACIEIKRHILSLLS